MVLKVLVAAWSMASCKAAPMRAVYRTSCHATPHTDSHTRVQKETGREVFGEGYLLEVWDESMSVHQRLAMLACAVSIEYDYRKVADADGLRVRRNVLWLKNNLVLLMRKAPLLFSWAVKMWKVLLVALAAGLHGLGISHEWLGLDEASLSDHKDDEDDATVAVPHTQQAEKSRSVH